MNVKFIMCLQGKIHKEEAMKMYEKALEECTKAEAHYGVVGKCGKIRHISVRIEVIYGDDRNDRNGDYHIQSRPEMLISNTCDCGQDICTMKNVHEL